MDFETVAQANKHAQAKEVLALRGYCVDADTAIAIVQVMPASYIFAVEGLRTTPTGKDKETVALSTNEVQLTFDLVKVQGRWLVSGFMAESIR
jgi:hypothetical protein